MMISRLFPAFILSGTLLLLPHPICAQAPEPRTNRHSITFRTRIGRGLCSRPEKAIWRWDCRTF